LSQHRNGSSSPSESFYPDSDWSSDGPASSSGLESGSGSPSESGSGSGSGYSYGRYSLGEFGSGSSYGSDLPSESESSGSSSGQCHYVYQLAWTGEEWETPYWDLVSSDCDPSHCGAPPSDDGTPYYIGQSYTAPCYPEDNQGW